MAAWSEMSGGAQAGIGAAAAVVVSLVAYFVFVPATEFEATAPVALLPQAGVAAAPEAVAPVSGEPEAVAPVIPALPAPSLDVVRVDADGNATIAGRAGAGDAIAFRLEAAEVFATKADASGNFVGLFSLPAAQIARILSVVAAAPDGQSRSIDVAIAPFMPAVTAPAEVAAPAAGADVVAEVEVQHAPAVLLLAPEGVKVLPAASAPSAQGLANVTLDSITYAPDGAVLLGGRGDAGSVVRIYLDDAAMVEAVISADGSWSAALGTVGAGIYTLRVDQLLADGKVSSRFETPFKRETPEALAAVVGQAAPQGVVAEAPAVGVAPAAEPAPEVSATSAAPETATPAALSAPATAAETVPKTAVSITVQPGFTLWGIAKREFGDGIMYVQVFDANKDRIKNPDLIYPGQVFLIPGSP